MSSNSAEPNVDSAIHSYRPLSRTVTATLTLRRRSLDPGKRLSILSRWAIGGVPWLALMYPEEGLQANFCIRWLLRVPEGNFALLERPEIYWDPDLQDPPQTVVKVLDESTILTLNTEEVNRILPAFKSDVLRRSDWPADKWKASFAKELWAVFGKEPKSSE